MNTSNGSHGMAASVHSPVSIGAPPPNTPELESHSQLSFVSTAAQISDLGTLSQGTEEGNVASLSVTDSESQVSIGSDAAHLFDANSAFIHASELTFTPPSGENNALQESAGSGIQPSNGAGASPATVILTGENADQPNDLSSMHFSPVIGENFQGSTDPQPGETHYGQNGELCYERMFQFKVALSGSGSRMFFCSLMLKRAEEILQSPTSTDEQKGSALETKISCTDFLINESDEVVKLCHEAADFMETQLDLLDAAQPSDA